MKRWRRLALISLLGLGLAATAGAALAQQVTQEASKALACLTPAGAERGLPVYPEQHLELRQDGRIKVQLEFSHAERRPAVKVLEEAGAPAFTDAVREHVREWRVPCLAELGGRARLEFDFVFRADTRAVVPQAPVDSYLADEREMLRCIVNHSGQKRPDYPAQARRMELQGRVVARLRFESPGEPPQVQLFSRRKADLLEMAVADWLQHARMPCHSGPPVTTLFTFVFRLENDVYGFKPMSLSSWMRATRNVGGREAEFDTRTMGCPFDVRVHYLQPHLTNTVNEIASHHPARRPLLDWLAHSELNLDGDQFDSVYGDFATLSVPCTKFVLKPQGAKP